jgi:GNAT superfamily N-acetyltransferase
MWWRLPRKEFEKQQGEGNKLAMKAIVESGQAPGILGYAEGTPAAWCSVAPREDYASLQRSRVLKPIDDLPVWSIVCFFVTKAFRGKGAGEAVIRGAVDYVRGQGGKIVEAYPYIPKSKQVPPVSSFMGFPSLYEKVGFAECAKPSASKMIMRFYAK